jgi:4-hydroxymandelate oxidase
MEMAADRRRFLKFLAASPLLARSPAQWGSTFAEATANEAGASQRTLIASPNEALNVLDFEPVARQILPPAHYGYLATGVDDDATLQANRAGFSKFQVRARRLVDVSRIDTSMELFAPPGRRRSCSRPWAARRRSMRTVRSPRRVRREAEVTY